MPLVDGLSMTSVTAPALAVSLVGAKVSPPAGSALRFSFWPAAGADAAGADDEEVEDVELFELPQAAITSAPATRGARRRTRISTPTPPTARSSRVVDGVFITETAPAGDGTALAVKDLFDTAGVRTTYGSAVFADHVPDATAEAVARLEAAGYASVGKANLHEFAWGITSENPHYGWVPNPLAEGRIAGGSSGGCAAALAAGLADAALGTDSGGSIRIPAACCGDHRLQADATAWCRSRAASRSRRASTTPGRWRATSRAARG